MFKEELFADQVKEAMSKDKKIASDIFNLLMHSLGPLHFETFFSLLFITDKFTESDVTNAKSILKLCATSILNLVIPSKTGKALLYQPG